MQSTDRLHALDAVRAYALLLGLVLHAATPWLQDVEVWPLRETPSAALATLWFVIHMFRMQVFFLIAGFFGCMVLEKRGLQAFIKDRAKRIVLPFVVGLPVIAILMALMYVAGILVSGHSLSELPATLQNSQAPRPASQQTGPNAGHLWFLYYLILFYAGAVLLHMLVNAIDRSGKIMKSIDAVVKFLMGPFGPLMLGVAFAIYFYKLPTWPSWTGLSGPRSFIPNGSFFGYGVIFALGWLLHRQKPLILRLETSWLLYCVLAIAFTLLSLNIGGLTPHWHPYMHGNELLLYSLAYMIGVWCWMFGLIGAALRFLSNESALRRYLADSSYWLYLMHVPLLLFLHAVLRSTQWHWSIEFSLSVLACVPVLLLTYHYWVRSTFIGETLNGRKIPRK